MSSKPARIELTTEREDLVIIEQMDDDRDIALCIMDDQGEEMRTVIRLSVLQCGLAYIGGDA